MQSPTGAATKLRHLKMNNPAATSEQRYLVVDQMPMFGDYRNQIAVSISPKRKYRDGYYGYSPQRTPIGLRVNTYQFSTLAAEKPYASCITCLARW